jgi:replicative DNA helicase
MSALDGATFALDAPADVAAVWGSGSRVLWAAGEPLMICGPEGVGKTTLGQQLALRRAGIGPADLLGQAVAADPARRVLYLALDRPQQARRSIGRMVTEHDRNALRERFVGWRGALPFDVATDPKQLAAFCRQHSAGTIVIDSLKDVALKLSEEATGQAINDALQRCVEAGLEVLALHHQRKAQGDNKKPRALADVYGSRWLTAGCGSVVMLWGEAGDPIVELSHLKQPADEVGPLTLLHDNRQGATTVRDSASALDVVAAADGPTTAKDVAAVLFKKHNPKPNDIEKARRRLEAEVEAGQLRRLPHEAGQSVRYTLPAGGAREGSRGSREHGHGEGHAGALRSRPSVSPAAQAGHAHAPRQVDGWDDAGWRSLLDAEQNGATPQSAILGDDATRAEQ